MNRPRLLPALLIGVRVVFLLLLVSLAVMLWRGVSRPENLTFCGPNQEISLVNESGQVIVSLVHLDFAAPSWMVRQGLSIATPQRGLRVRYTAEYFDVDGFSLYVARAPGGWTSFAQRRCLPWSQDHLGPMWNSASPPYASGRQLGVPIWLLRLLSATPLLFWVARLWRGRRLGRAGLCTRCQYDLRGNQEAVACPECGQPVAAAQQSAE